ncbi:SixA phosphatase family protein [Thiomicrolovo sp. ZZH C-3]
MRTLTLMRHAKSSWDDPALGDHERPLNARGRKAAKTMAQRLHAEPYTPDLVLVSSALRTRQTAEALQKAYDGALAVQTEPLLYEATSETYAEVIRKVDDAVDALMIIGHNPTLEWIAETLGGKAVHMPTAAYIRFEIPCRWSAFEFERYKTLAYDYPKSDR